MSQTSTAAATLPGAIVISKQQPTSPAAAADTERYLLASRPRLCVSACSSDYWHDGRQTEISAGQLHTDHICY